MREAKILLLLEPQNFKVDVMNLKINTIPLIVCI